MYIHLWGFIPCLIPLQSHSHSLSVPLIIQKFKISFSDAPALININLYVRSISRIDDVKMVRLYFFMHHKINLLLEELFLDGPLKLKP